VKLARLHRRLVSAMALAALLAFAAGGGVTPAVVVAALALVVSLFWLPPPATGVWIERATRFGVVGLCAWMVYAAGVLGQDFMPGVIAMLLFLLGGEGLRPLQAHNDMRLYSLSFALLIGATAYYPGPGFALGFIAYVGLAVLGMMVGYLRRESERFGAGGLRVGRGFLWTTAGLSLVTLAMSGAVFVLFPRLPRAWNVQGRRGSGGEFAGFSDRVSIGEFGGRIGANPETMFRVEFPDGVPDGVEEIHWHGRSFNRFDGESWSRGGSSGDLFPALYARRWGGPFLRMRVFGGPPGAEVIFGPQPMLRVEPRSAIHIYRSRSGDFVFAGSDNPVYTVTSTLVPPSDAQLAASDVSLEPVPTAALQLPPLDPRVQRLADSLTAGAGTRLEQVRAVEGWLRTRFRYSLELPRSRSQASIEAFLFERREGHCEYFSTALALLLRAEGIPTRNVNGFLGGEWNASAGYLVVTGNHAHSWVEVWFPEYGWVPFDATPPGTADLLDRLSRDSWLWSTRLWLDGLEYRWYKWVLDYNLDRQIRVFGGIRDFFSQGERVGPQGRPAPLRNAAPWFFEVLGAGVLWGLWRGRRRQLRLGPASRVYLGLRKSYARAGWTTDAGGPLEFAQTVQEADAPGAEDAARAVDLYLKQRFSGDTDEGTQRALGEAAGRAKQAVQRAPRRKARAGADS
jgi:transglutaminase-like putative cysteine protease